MIDKITRAMKMDRFEVSSALNQEKSGELGVMYSMLCEEWRKENGAHATLGVHLVLVPYIGCDNRFNFTSLKNKRLVEQCFSFE